MADQVSYAMNFEYIILFLRRSIGWQLQPTTGQTGQSILPDEHG